MGIPQDHLMRLDLGFPHLADALIPRILINHFQMFSVIMPRSTLRGGI
jgi:hypothetical protein